MLCRTVNRLFSVPPLSRIAPTPAVDDRTDMPEFQKRSLAGGTEFLREFAPLNKIKGRLVLDAGCGLGGKTVPMASSGAAGVVGIDTDPEKIHWARTLAAGAGVDNVSFAVQSASLLGFPDGHFDLVLLADVIEHLEDPLAALLECARVLVPGGTALVGFPPYLSPWRAHLFTHIRIPWAHVLLPEREVLDVWRARHEDRLARGEIYCSETRARCIMKAETVAELWGLNRITIAEFLRLVRETPFRTRLLRLKTPGGLGSFLTRSSFLREYVVTRLVAVLER